MTPGELEIVSTFPSFSRPNYVEDFVRSVLSYWPDIVFRVFVDTPEEPPADDPRMIVRVLEHDVPALTTFKTSLARFPMARGQIPTDLERGGEWPSYNYSYAFDAIRFAHKVFATCHAATVTDRRYLLWLDADTRTFAPIDDAFFKQLGDCGGHVLYLGRSSIHSETGFILYDLSDPRVRKFLALFRRLYEDHTIFAAGEWNDSFVFDWLRMYFESNGSKIFQSLSGQYAGHHHPFINCFLGDYIDHFKGERKSTGRSHQLEMVARRRIAVRL